MGDSMARLVAKLEVDRKGMQKGLKGATGDLKSFAKGALTIAAPLAAAFSARAMTQAAQQQFRAEKKLEAVLKATGGAARLSAGEINRYALELQKLTGIADEETINAAGMLATFKSVQGDTFKQALALSQDLAATLDGDVKGAVVQIGKALNDPIKGVSSLAESGVSFTQEQLRQIRNMQTQGDLLGAQKIILQELTSEVGGVAAGMKDPVEALNATFSNIAKDLGNLILPSMQGIADETANWVEQLETADFKSIGEEIAQDVVPAVSDLAWGLGQVAEFVGPIADGLLDIARIPIGLGLDALGVGGGRQQVSGSITPEELKRQAGPLSEQQRRAFMPGMSDREFTKHEVPTGPKAAQLPAELKPAITGGINAALGFFGDVAEAAEAFKKDMQETLDRNLKFQKDITDLYAETRTPMERFQAEQDRLMALLAQGADEGLITRGLESALGEFASTIPEGIAGDSEAPVNRAIELGTSDAFDAIIRATSTTTQDPASTQRETQINLLREANELLRNNKIEVRRWY